MNIYGLSNRFYCSCTLLSEFLRFRGFGTSSVLKWTFEAVLLI
ncbi:hypothetical protein LEP1GSC128_1527 [Leptospira borgpetersenii str. 200801926]|uniref:Uncharacterized protein n=1 Tax=Leptospira borgpetersenii str. 200801926 TaxID=1193009 RepID=A0ABN0I0G6_LEPBO|nr:hypothetical protein LEP1GSC128_1527 [Leptospira borgpetersenii str. 200801926]